MNKRIIHFNVKRRLIFMKIKYFSKRSLLLIYEMVGMIMNGGGTIYVGMSENGTAYGIDNANLLTREIAHTVLNLVPNYHYVIDAYIEPIQGKEVVRIEINVKQSENALFNQYNVKNNKNKFIPINQLVG